jgi:hypothetical protein
MYVGLYIQSLDDVARAIRQSVEAEEAGVRAQLLYWAMRSEQAAATLAARRTTLPTSSFQAPRAPSASGSASPRTPGHASGRTPSRPNAATRSGNTPTPAVTFTPSKAEAVEFMRILLQPLYNEGLLRQEDFARIVRKVSAEVFAQGGDTAAGDWKDKVRRLVQASLAEMRD